MPILTTKCSKCGNYKPSTLEYFAPRKAKRNGFTSWCRECLREKEKTRVRIHPQAESRKYRYSLLEKGLGKCTTCENVLSLTRENFSPMLKSATGFTSICRNCARKRARNIQAERRSDPIERIRVLAEKQRYSQSAKGRESKRKQSKIYNHKRKQKHLKLEFIWTRKDWEFCKKQWDYKCAYCGCKSDKLTQDHFIPIAAPDCIGTVKENIVPACSKCNSTKRHRPAHEFCSESTIKKIMDYFKTF